MFIALVFLVLLAMDVKVLENFVFNQK